MTKKSMMKAAHKIAKRIVEYVGNYMVALQIALKEVWRQVKTYNKKRFGAWAIESAAARLATPKVEKESVDSAFGIPAWIIRKNLNSNEAYAVLNQSSSMNVVRETEKAQLVEFETDFGTVQLWTPKSVLVAA